MSGFKRGVLSAWTAVALLATGCDGGGEVIPLADVPPSKVNPDAASTPAKSKRPAGVPTSPQELIYK